MNFLCRALCELVSEACQRTLSRDEFFSYQKVDLSQNKVCHLSLLKPRRHLMEAAIMEQQMVLTGLPLISPRVWANKWL